MTTIDDVTKVVQGAEVFPDHGGLTYDKLWPLGYAYFECDGRDGILDTVKKDGQVMHNGLIVYGPLFFQKQKTGYKIMPFIKWPSIEVIDSLPLTVPVYMKILEGMAKLGHKWKLIVEVK